MAKVHKKRSDLKASVRRAALGQLIDIVLMLAAITGVVLACVRRPAWLDRLQVKGVPGLAVVCIVGAALVLVLWLRFRHNGRDRAVRHAGVEGENAALTALKKALPGDYQIISNVKVVHDGRESEMDLVVVGPGGVSVVEVKNYAGEIGGDAGARDLYHINHGRSEKFYSPMKQVATHVHRLSGFLRDRGMRVWVRGFVFFVNPGASVRITGRSDAAWYTADQVQSLAADLRSGRDKLRRSEVEAIVDALRKA